jgi:hypothetical protein
MKFKSIIIAMFAAIILVGIGIANEKAETIPDPFFGSYVTELPSASGMGRLIVLHIFENGNALRTNVYIGKPNGDYIEEGTWSIQDGILTVIIANTAEPPEEIELIFTVEENGLRSVKYDESPLGNSEVFFTRVQKSF